MRQKTVFLLCIHSHAYEDVTEYPISIVVVGRNEGQQWCGEREVFHLNKAAAIFGPLLLLSTIIHHYDNRQGLKAEDHIYSNSVSLKVILF